MNTTESTSTENVDKTRERRVEDFKVELYDLIFKAGVYFEISIAIYVARKHGLINESTSFQDQMNEACDILRESHTDNPHSFNIDRSKDKKHTFVSTSENSPIEPVTERLRRIRCVTELSIPITEAAKIEKKLFKAAGKSKDSTWLNIKNIATVEILRSSGYTVKETKYANEYEISGW